MDERIENNVKTILIVDDEEPIVDILAHNLKKEGYNTLEANDGLEAVEIATTKKPDLILLDIMLPKIDGYHVYENINFIPVIFLTAKDSLQDKVKGLTI